MDPDVIVGRDGWLFLDEGSNDSASYLTGARPVERAVQDSWHRVIADRNDRLPAVVHLICPEKLAVFPELHDRGPFDPDRLAVRLARLPRVLYPVDELAAGAEQGLRSYIRTDSHFTDLGAAIAVRLVLKAFGQDVDLHEDYRLRLINGDLGIKFTPCRSSETLVLPNLPGMSVSDNGLTNRGRILHILSPRAPLGRLLIFGDSFSGLALARVFARAFSEVVFLNNLSADDGLIARLAPDLVVFEMAERFLRTAPADGDTLSALIAMRHRTGHAEAVEAWRTSSSTTRDMVDWVEIDRLIAARTRFGW